MSPTRVKPITEKMLIIIFIKENTEALNLQMLLTKITVNCSVLYLPLLILKEH